MRHETRRSNDFTRVDPDAGRKQPVPGSRGVPHPASRRPQPTDEEIRVRAYYLWEAAGRPAGDGVAFWLAAERELRGR
jgi:hypothetical protein